MLRFTKMQGAGNDFVVFDGIHQTLGLTPERVRQLADRRFGIGCDQVLVVEPPSATAGPGIPFRYRIFNRDGDEVEQCGNGARCFARFVREYGLSDADRLWVETAAGPIELVHQADGQVSVAMGRPRFALEEIPFKPPAEAPGVGTKAPQAGPFSRYRFEAADRTESFHVVSLGNPHAVIRVPSVDSTEVVERGEWLQGRPEFPRGVNVGFMEVIDPTTIRLRVLERGAGETLACGTGACAAVVVGERAGWLTPPVSVHLPGGTLQIDWPEAAASVRLTGPAERVFEGEIEP